MILALALADVKAGGSFGKVVKQLQGTSDVGPVTGGGGRRPRTPPASDGLCPRARRKPRPRQRSPRR